jgi:phosphomannomutase
MQMDSIDERIFKAYDIRGIYPTQLNENNIVSIIQAIYTFFSQKIKKDKFSVVLSYDMRLSGPKLFNAAKQTLVDMGAQVIDTGMLSTPSFYFTVSHYGYDCGIQITASHNPKEWNGMKFVINSPTGLIKIGKSTGMEEIKKMSTQGIKMHAQKDGAVVEKPATDILKDEVENALSLFENPTIKKYKIVADPANAMGAQYIDAIFKKVPADLTRMNFELDGSFPAHQPDPLNFDNLKDLRAQVIKDSADFGLAPDGDGDRLYFIDEKGNVIPATIITALVSRELLKENPGATILFDIRYILGSKKIVEEYGGKSVVTKVGHAFITERLSQTGGIFAGESSGHFYYKANGNAESQLATIICVLKVLTEENKTLSEVAKELQRSYESGEFNFKTANAQIILEKLKEKYKNGELDILDGVSISYSNWRFNVRISNTEPLLRLNVESYDQSIMNTRRDELIAFIKSLA